MQRRQMMVIGVSAVFVALSGLLAASWLTRDGHLRNARWQQPQPVTTDVAALVPNMPQSQAAGDAQLLMQLQERPLFILSRRPLPSLKKTEEKAPEPDIWDQARLLGIFQGHKSGVILMVQGKEQRLMLNQSLGGWTLSSILPRQIELNKGGVKRSLQLFRAPLDGESASRTPAFASNPAPRAPAVVSNPVAPPPAVAATPTPAVPANAAPPGEAKAANKGTAPPPAGGGAVFGGTASGK